MVSLAKKSPKERLNICRKYYLAGFAFLPLLWLINTIWFYKQAFKVDHYPEQAQIRTCKILFCHNENELILQSHGFFCSIFFSRRHS